MTSHKKERMHDPILEKVSALICQDLGNEHRKNKRITVTASIKIVISCIYEGWQIVSNQT